MKHSNAFISISLLLFCSCSGETTETAVELPVVVEGWIESGGCPVVILSNPICDLSKDYTEEELEKLVLSWAKVTVSDGETSSVLAGGVDRNYFPPYIYTGTGIRGEAGKTYYLNVEYGGGKTVTAQTTIPSPVPIERMKLRWREDTTAFLEACFSDTCVKQNYYQFFVRKYGEEGRYYPSVGGAIDNQSLNELMAKTEKYVENPDIQRIVYQIWPGVHFLSSEVYRSFYTVTDTLMVKLARMDEVSFAYWNRYHEVSDFGIGLSMFLSVSNLPTNIQGGLGYWCGYGVSQWNVTVGDSVR